jgi:uncharacterized protein (DUF362 family)
MSEQPQNPNLSRRDFLRLTGVAAASLLASGCQPEPATPIPGQPSSQFKTSVAIGQVKTYDRAAIESQMQKLIEQLGGLGDVVKPGDSVAIKTNLTGGTGSGRLPGLRPEESFVTHPEVVRALAKEVKAAGAKEVFIVEAVYEWASYTEWGYEDLARDLGVTLIDLNQAKPFTDFKETAVGPVNLIYNSFIFNPILSDIDVFMSVSKMKNHYLAGVTHTMKNLYGLVPYRFYRSSEQDKYRSGFHGTETQTRERLPRIVVDLNRARPIHFSLIDGIKTTQGGEGPWIESLAPIEPGVLIAGKNPVATDAVATTVMGHDPTGDYPDSPFVRCVNHLNLAAQAGLGTNRLDEIEVLGAAINDVKTQFTPAP